MAASINHARFKINGTPSEDSNGNRWYIASFSETLELTLEVNPSPVLSVTYEVFSSADPGSPYASKNAPALTFNESGSYRFTPDVPNDTATIALPSSGVVTYTLRATVVLAGGGNDVFDRMVAIRTSATVPPIRKTVPAETAEFEARGHSDTLNDMVDALQNLASGGGGGVTLDGAYDFGGPGIGRHIIADAGAVDITVPAAATNNGLDITRHSAPSASPMADHYSIFLTGHNDQSIVTDKDLYVGRRDAGGGEAYAWFRESAAEDGGSIWLMAMPDSPDPGREAFLQLTASTAGGTALLYAGDVAFDDGHRIGSTWSSSGIKLSSSQSNWSDAEVLGGGEVSVLELILAAAASGGGTLDDAYDYIGSGAGRTINADSGAVYIIVSNGSGNEGLRIDQNDTVNHSNGLNIVRNSVPTSNPAFDAYSLWLTGNEYQSIYTDKQFYIGRYYNGHDKSLIAHTENSGGDGGNLNLSAHADTPNSGTSAYVTLRSSSYVGGGEVELSAGKIYFADSNIFGSTWSDPSGIVVSSSPTEWDDIEALIGYEGSLFGAILAAAASGGGTLDDAYNYGGPGLGKSITVNSGAVAMTVPTSVSSAALALTNQEPTNTSELLNLHHQAAASTGYAIYIDGTQGGGTGVGEFGHKIWSPGSITIGHSDDDGLATGRRSFLSLQFSEQPQVPGVPSCKAILESSANESGVLDYSSLYARVVCESGDYSSIGSSIKLETVGSCSIDAGTYGSFTFGGNLTIDANALSLNDLTKLTHVHSATYGSAPTTATYTAGTETVSIDLSDGKPYQEVPVTGDVSNLIITNPNGVMMGIQVTLYNDSGTARSVGSLSNVEWMIGADLADPDAAEIPVYGWMHISLLYNGTNYKGWYGVYSQGGV